MNPLNHLNPRGVIYVRKAGLHYPGWLAAPAALIYGFFFIVPILMALVLSFTDWNINRMSEPVFNGLHNFRKLLTDEIFLHSLKNTFIFAIFTTIGKTIAGLALALMLYKPRFGNNVFRTIFYMPSVLSAVVVGLLFNSILGMDGLLNNFLAKFGVAPTDWLGNYGTAMTWIILMEIWMWSGFIMFIFISGLQAIPQDYYEFAELEGASKLHQFFHVTLPLLGPTFTVVFTLNITGGLKVFDMVYILTNGGPGYATQVLSTYTYRAFGLGLLGQASASSLILSVIVVVITFIFNSALKKREVEM